MAIPRVAALALAAAAITAATVACSTTRGGKSYLVSVLTQNPATALNETKAELTLISAVKGAFQLAAT